MITCTSKKNKYKSVFSNGRFEAYADTNVENGGKGSGFRPHDLLEAAFGTCLNMWIRMIADKEGIPLSQVITKVDLDRSFPEQTIFKYTIKLYGNLSDKQHNLLFEQVEKCPVHETLSKKILFQCMTD